MQEVQGQLNTIETILELVVKNQQVIADRQEKLMQAISTIMDVLAGEEEEPETDLEGQAIPKQRDQNETL